MFIFSELLSAIALAIAIFVVRVQAEGYYTITSPGYIRPNSIYTVYASVKDVTENTKIQLSLKGPIPEKTSLLDVPPNSQDRITFALGEIPQGDYTLEAQGISGIIFKKVVKLEFVKNPPQVYIQTDKALYRHGEIIQFRVIFLDQFLLPAKISQPISVIIKDADSNRIQIFDDIKLKTGVFKGKLKLADSVVSGEWKLEVYLGSDLIKDKVVKVKEFRLPLFEITLEAPDFVAYSQRKFPVKVKADYTYGKPVTGNCIFNFNLKRSTIRATYPLKEGKADTIVELSRFGKRTGNIHVNVTIEDPVMRMSQTVSKNVTILPKRYEIHRPYTMKKECNGPQDTFIYRAHIVDINGDQIDPDDDVYITLDDGNSSGEPETLVSSTDANGYVETEIECSNHANVNVTIDYRGQKEMDIIEFYHQSGEGKGGVYVLKQFPMVDSPIDIRLVSHEEFTNFACLIIGRGNIVYDDIIRIPGGVSSRTHTFTVTVTYEMMPKAHIFVYFHKNGKMIYYETTFYVEKQFKNSIYIEAPETVKPGTHTSINFITDSESYVGLLGMDKSALLLKSGNDLDAEVIFKHLEDIETKTPQSYLPLNGSYPGEIAGLVTMTNAQPSGEITDADKTIRIESHYPRKRRNFFETFAFDDIECVDDSQSYTKSQIPDTITSWAITGFSISPEKGFALTTTPTLVRTFLEFFVVVNLPYSVKVGETLTIPVVIFNYLQSDTIVNVVMKIEKDEYEFVGNPSLKADTVKTFVNREKSETVYFAIRPKIAGKITLQITAKSPYAKDTIIKKLKVEYEGITEWGNVDIFINGDESKAIKLNIPENSVPGSEQIDISVMDYIMGSMLNLVNSGENFDQLIRSPTGCGEQNMIHSVANLMVLKYLKSTNTVNQNLYNKAKTNLQAGYQREFTYKLKDNSFSTWGNEPGFTWLTAYVVRIFNEAKAYIYVDDEILRRSLDFLASKQEADGSFREDGRLTDFANLNKLFVTASVLYTFLENTQHFERYKSIVEKGLDYVRNNVKENGDMRAVALSLYVLQKCKDPMVQEILTKLESKAKVNNDHKWWQHDATTPSHIDVHITSYILMTMIELNKPIKSIVKWLVSKRNSNGGFASTLETEGGLRALSNYAQSYKAVGNNLIINVKSNGQLLQEFTLDENKKNVNKKISLPRHIRDLDFTAVGNGQAIFQISYSYNSLESTPKTFNLHSTIDKRSGGAKILEICTRLIQPIATNMAVMEVILPSGEQVGPDCCDIKNAKLAKRIKLSNLDQKVDIYFNALENYDSECLYIPTMKVHDVTDQKAGSIVMYDYYNKNSVDKYFYRIE